MRDEALLQERLKDCKEELNYFLANKNTGEPDSYRRKDHSSEPAAQVNFTAADFISENDFEMQIENRSCVYFGNEPVNRSSLLTIKYPHTTGI